MRYADCCGRYVEHFESMPTPDAQALMRSRYSAFVLERAAYLLATWHATTCPPDLQFEPGARWLGLEVRSHRPIDDEHAAVEFVARYRVAGRAVQIAECSRFVREAGRWFYVDGATSAEDSSAASSVGSLTNAAAASRRA